MDSIGIIVKIKGKKSIIVSEDGSFETIKSRDGMFLGQKVLYSHTDLIEQRKNTVRYLYPVIAGIAAIFIFVISYFGNFYTREVYAFISVDINPSIEFSVNEDGIIQDAVPLNYDAKKLLEDLRCKGLSLQDVLLDLINKSQELRFIDKADNKNLVLISAALNSNEREENSISLQDKLIGGFKENVMKLNIDIDIQFVEVSADLRKKALENKVSMGKYLVYEKVRAEGNNISIEELKDAKLYSLLEENNINISGSRDYNSGINHEENSKDSVFVTNSPEMTPAITPSQLISPLTTPVSIVTPSSHLPESTARTDTGPDYTVTPVLFKTTPTPLIPTHTWISTPPTTTPTTTPTFTPKPKPTPTLTPIVPTLTSAAPIPTPSSSYEEQQGVKVQFYNDNAVPKTNSTYLRVKLFNTGKTPINLTDVKIRYYYTIDGYKDQQFYCDWSHVKASNVTGEFVQMSNPVNGADTYLEMGFTSGAGILDPGKSIIMNIRYSKADWSQYNQSNDYSFNNVSNNFIDWNKVTVYVSDSLKWGIEP